MASSRARPSPAQKFWAEHIHCWQNSGLTQADYCRQHSLNPNTFYSWVHQLGITRKGVPPSAPPSSLPQTEDPAPAVAVAPKQRLPTWRSGIQSPTFVTVTGPKTPALAADAATPAPNETPLLTLELAQPRPYRLVISGGVSKEMLRSVLDVLEARG